MKSYEERLPLIDAAIDELKGEFPPTAIGYSGRGYYAKGDFANILHGVNIGDICTRDEFEQRKAELQNKPNWEDAPEWVDYIAQDRDGTWRGFYLKPVATHKHGSGLSYWGSGHTSMVFGCGKAVVNWQDTLEQRPEKTLEEIGVTIEEGRMNTDIWSEKPKEKGMNDWYDKGELPPVGERCISVDPSGIECSGEVVKHSSDGECALFVRDDESIVFWQKEFRPLRTERDALVEKAEMDIHQNHSDMVSRHHIRTLIDAGWRPVKQQTEEEFITQARRELTDHISTNQIAKLYRAGCRFIEQVEV